MIQGWIRIVTTYGGSRINSSIGGGSLSKSTVSRTILSNMLEPLVFNNILSITLPNSLICSRSRAFNFSRTCCRFLCRKNIKSLLILFPINWLYCFSATLYLNSSKGNLAFFTLIGSFKRKRGSEYGCCFAPETFAGALKDSNFGGFGDLIPDIDRGNVKYPYILSVKFVIISSRENPQFEHTSCLTCHLLFSPIIASVRRFSFFGLISRNRFVCGKSP